MGEYGDCTGSRGREPQRLPCIVPASGAAGVDFAAGARDFAVRHRPRSRVRLPQNTAPRRIVQCMLLALAAVPSALAAQSADAVRVELNIPAQRLSVYSGSERLRTYTVAVGLPGFETPVGRFHITRAEWNPWWHPPVGSAWARDQKVTPPGPANPMGRVKLNFAPLYFIHGTPHGESLGAPASRGCVRMSNADAVDLATLLHRYAAPTLPSGEIPRVLDGPRATRVSHFRRPVLFEIRYDLLVVEDDEILVFEDVYRRGGLTGEAVRLALARAGAPPHDLHPPHVDAMLQRARSRPGTYRIGVRHLLRDEAIHGGGEATGGP
jgi:lipoprotein-anchoring transpeptidase ErfK/SrfK